MICSDVMRHPVRSCNERHTAEAAAAQMRDAGIGFLPVCDAAGHVRGVVTDRDLAVRVCAAGLDPGATEVGAVMTHELVECRPDDDLSRARQLMASRHKSRILITDAEGRPVGVISLADLARRDPRHGSNLLSSVVEREVLDAGGRIAGGH